jgi:hypothetical protein
MTILIQKNPTQYPANAPLRIAIMRSHYINHPLLVPTYKDGVPTNPDQQLRKNRRYFEEEATKLSSIKLRDVIHTIYSPYIIGTFFRDQKVTYSPPKDIAEGAAYGHFYKRVTNLYFSIYYHLQNAKLNTDLITALHGGGAIMVTPTPKSAAPYECSVNGRSYNHRDMTTIYVCKSSRAETSKAWLWPTDNIQFHIHASYLPVVKDLLSIRQFEEVAITVIDDFYKDDKFRGIMEGEHETIGLLCDYICKCYALLEQSICKAFDMTVVGVK